MIIHTIEARTHGRYLVDRLDRQGWRRCWSASTATAKAPSDAANCAHRPRAMAAGDNDDWCLVSVQALNRFYNRANEVVAQLDDPAGP